MTERLARRLLLLATVIVTAGANTWACSGSDRPPPASGAEPETTPSGGEAGDATAALLPRAASDMAPSLARVVEGEAVDVARLADVEACESCHTDTVAHWRNSAHARSSFDNPWYRSSVEQFRQDRSNEESRFCAGCHDPMLLLSGRIDEEIETSDPLAYAGVTCLVCHGVVEARPDGNGSYTLTSAPVPMPVAGDGESLRRHIERVTPDPLRTPDLCASCHRVFLSYEMGNPHFLPGLDDAEPWRGSQYGGSQASLLDDPVEESTCQGCHMSDEAARLGDVAAAEGMLRSHRFPGGQTALAEQQSDAQLAAVRAQLGRAPTIDVAALVKGDGTRALPADGADVRPGETVAIDVVVRNTGTGHDFPGGVRDTQDTWIEVVIADARGRVIAGAGDRHEECLDDDTAHRLITMVIDGQGQPQLAHRVSQFHTAAMDHTVTARDARVARYEVTLPRSLGADAFPLRIAATLHHRRHVAPMHTQACASTRSERGQAFRDGAREAHKTPVDGCTPQPVTELARAAVWVGEGSEDRLPEGGAARARWRRLWEHAIGLSHQVQERLDEARPSLDRARALIAETPPADVGLERARAMLLAVEATVDSRQGRLDDALEHLDQAEALVGEHAALSRIRGDANARVWRWRQAATAYDVTARLASGDTTSWRDLARARGSAGEDTLALEAAVRGLALLPRDEGLLRSQTLALEHLDRAGDGEARNAFLDHRLPDDASDVRLRCERSVEHCHRDRQPVPRIEMRVY